MKSHNTKRLILFLKGIPFSFLSLILPRKKRIIFNSTHNENFTFNSKFLFLYFLENEKQVPFYFVINDQKKRESLTSQYGDYFIEANSFSGILFILQSKVWITSSLETPIGGFCHSFRREVIHLGHGTPIKNIGLLEKNISLLKKIYYRIVKTNFTYLISSSKVFVPIWASFLNFSQDKVFVLGQPRCDYIKEQTKENEKRKILYAPTWRPYEYNVLEPFDDFDLKKLETFLDNSDTELYLRLHPLNEKRVNSFKFNKNIKLLDSSDCPDIIDQLDEFDILITDYSSIFFDYLYLNRPIIFLRDDINPVSYTHLTLPTKA